MLSSETTLRLKERPAPLIITQNSTDMTGFSVSMATPTLSSLAPPKIPSALLFSFYSCISHLHLIASNFPICWGSPTVNSSKPVCTNTFCAIAVCVKNRLDISATNKINGIIRLVYLVVVDFDLIRYRLLFIIFSLIVINYRFDNPCWLN